MHGAPLSRMLGGCDERSLAHSPRCGRRAAGRERAAAAAARSACCWSISARRTRPMRPSVRRYLKEFLSDPRVIENQGPLWSLILNGIILPVRPRRKARDYRKIWNRERNESPLKTITRAQAEKLGGTLEPLGPSRRGRLGDALRQSVDRVAARAHGGAGLRAHPGDPALSAILRGDHRDRRATRSSACSCACAGSRRCGLRRRTTTTRSISRRWRPRPAPSCRSSTFKPEVDPRLVPRHAAGVCRQGRSLLRPLPRDHAAAARAAQARRDRN